MGPKTGSLFSMIGLEANDKQESGAKVWVTGMSGGQRRAFWMAVSCVLTDSFHSLRSAILMSGNKMDHTLREPWVADNGALCSQLEYTNFIKKILFSKSNLAAEVVGAVVRETSDKSKAGPPNKALVKVSD